MIPILTGPSLILRPPRPADREERLHAGRDPEFRRMVGGIGPDPGPLTPAEADRWYSSVSGDPFAWVIEVDGRCAGVARLHHVNVDKGSAEYAIGLFRPDHRGRGLGTEATRLVLDHAFGSMGLQRVTLRVLDFNRRAIACYRRSGFVEVAREPVTLGDRTAADVIMEVRASRAGSAERSR